MADLKSEVQMSAGLLLRRGVRAAVRFEEDTMNTSARRKCPLPPDPVLADLPHSFASSMTVTCCEKPEHEYVGSLYIISYL